MDDLACAWCEATDTCVPDGSFPNCNRLSSTVWAGTYTVDAGCDQATCCCATGSIVATASDCSLTFTGSQATTNPTLSDACDATFSWSANSCDDTVTVKRAAALGDVTLSKPALDSLSITDSKSAACSQTASCASGACNVVNNFLGLAKTVFYVLLAGFIACVVATVVGIYCCCCRSQAPKTYYHMAPQPAGGAVVVGGQQVGYQAPPTADGYGAPAAYGGAPAPYGAPAGGPAVYGAAGGAYQQTTITTA